MERERYLLVEVRPTLDLDCRTMRLRPLSEAECYARCYGAHRDDRVSVVRAPRRASGATANGERMRELFEQRLDARGPEDGGGMTRVCHTWTGRRADQVTAGRKPAPPLPSSWVCTATWTQRMPRCKPRGRQAHLARLSAVPDVLAPGLRCVFCGINPGRVSAAAAAHFANPRNDFWRLLHDAGFTPRPLRAGGAVLAARARPRGHQRRLPNDAGLGRSPPRRLRPGRTRARSRASCGRGRSRSSARRPTAASSTSGPSSARSCARSDRPRCTSCRRPRLRTPPFPTRSDCAGSRRYASGSSRSRARLCAA